MSVCRGIGVRSGDVGRQIGFNVNVLKWSSVCTGHCAGVLLGWRVIGNGGDEFTHRPLLRITDGGGDRNMSGRSGESRVGRVMGIGRGKIR